MLPKLLLLSSLPLALAHSHANSRKTFNFHPHANHASFQTHPNSQPAAASFSPAPAAEGRARFLALAKGVVDGYEGQDWFVRDDVSFLFLLAREGGRDQVRQEETSQARWR